MPTPQQLKNRLNPTPFTIKIPTQGLFRARGAVAGSSLFNRVGNKVYSIDLTNTLLPTNAERLKFGNFGGQSAEALRRLKSKYGVDYNKLPKVNIGDLTQAAATGKSDLQLAQQAGANGGFGTLAFGANNLNQFLGVDVAKLERQQRNAQKPTEKIAPQAPVDIYAFNKAIVNKDIPALKAMGVDTTTLGSSQAPIDTKFLSQFLTPEQIQGIKTAQQTVADAGLDPSKGKVLDQQGIDAIQASLPSVVPSPTPQTATPNLPQPQAQNIQQAYGESSQANLDTSRTTIETAYKTQIDELNKQIEDSKKSIEELNTLQANGVADVGSLLEPFRQKLQDAERQRLHINKNFEDNQKLTDELGTLLTEGNALIKQQQEVTGLTAIRNPRIAKTISDVNARAGVIQAVMNARNGQIAQAQNMIDRSVNAINADKKDQLTYYNTLLNFYEGQKDAEGKKLVTLDKTKRQYINSQIGLLKTDLAQSQANTQYIKELMTSPDTAGIIAKAGVTLNDSPEQVNAKLARQSDIQDIQDFTNKMVAKGYEPVAFPKGGEQTFTIGGRQLAFKPPVVEAKTSKQTAPTSPKPMSVNQVDSFRRSYGWTPPFGYSQEQLLRYMQDNPNATPQELEAGAKQATGGDTPTTTQTPTPIPTPTVTTDSIISSIMGNISDSTLRALKLKADKAGVSQFFRGKTKDVKAYLESIKDKIQTAIDQGYSTEEITSFLTT